MTSELSLPRQFGEYVLVAQLGEDGLGTVYRALASSDERRFMRLRILQSAELLPEAVVAAVRKNAARATSLLHKTIVLRTEMGIVEGVPFVAWYETAGWTLNVLLARLRANATVLPPEYALLIAERVAAALAHAWFSVVDGEPFHHGLLWPGFVSITNDAEVRVGGFGLAEGVLPSVAKTRLLRDIAPYLPIEVREKKRVEVSSDVYSLGVLLLELLTGRRPTLRPLLPELRAEDPFAAQVGGFLRSCCAEPSQRFSSVVQMHRALQELLAGSPYALSTASLAVFLYKLLNPESRVLPTADGESTNPVALEGLDSQAGGAAGFLPEETAPGERRRQTMTPLLPSTTHEEASLPHPPSPIPHPPTPTVIDSTVSEPAPVARRAMPAEDRGRPSAEPQRSERTFPTRLIALAASLVLITAVALFLRAGGGSSSRSTAATLPAPVHVASAPPAAAVSSSPQRKSAHARPALHEPSNRQAGKRRAASGLSAEEPAADGAAVRKPAEDSRLAAALARVEAERLDAEQWAADVLVNGKSRQQEGERLLTERDWTGARAAFERATALFREAENAAREERVRRVKLLPPD